MGWAARANTLALDRLAGRITPLPKILPGPPSWNERIFAAVWQRMVDRIQDTRSKVRTP